MSTSGNGTTKRQMGKTGFVYLLASLFCIFFGAVYEYFSHEVYSGFMIYAFVFPLAGGALPFLALALYGGRRLPGRASRNLYSSGIAALTVGSLMEGALEIYGTTNDILRVYWVAGVGLVGAAIFIHLISRKK